eukprot:TRINITY_DN1903_c1_g1_i1.p1 TRINITY_DN1903_c1_g1~~TRINITY_DN1903_c1_g1_i1.p1  ORF type:complete len:399 (-),score=133.87 TRINITY_DN1903_c1_g1_i1:518-1714(-)
MCVCVQAAGGLEAQLDVLGSALQRRGRPVVVASVRRPVGSGPEATAVISAADKLLLELEQLIAHAKDAGDKQRLIEQRNALRAKMAAAVRASAAAGGPVPGGLHELAEAADGLAAAVAALRVSLADAATRSPPKAAEARQQQTLTRDEEQLLSAASQEAAGALTLAAEALLLPSATADAAELSEAAAELKAAAARVQQAVGAVQANPSAASHEALQTAQHEMRSALARLVAATRHSSSEAAAVLSAAPAPAAASVTGIGQLGRQLQQQLAVAFTSLLTPKEMIVAAKSVADTAHRLLAMLRLLSTSCSDSVFQQNLTQASNIISDSVIQLKILATVRAAEGGDSGVVQASANSFQRTVGHVLQEIEAANLQTLYRSTLQHTAALNRLCAALKRHRSSV